ncbi:MAG: hydroxymethylglutaryl-CoA lyase [Pseudomonadota bacterium]
MTDRFEIVEMAPRDGLQNEKVHVPTEQKIALVDMLSGAGFARIEVTSFVSPKWVPQLADARDVMEGIDRDARVAYGVLTPNIKGLERALDARPDWVAVFASASEGFSRANLNCSIEESLERFRPVVTQAMAAGVAVRGYVSCVTDCPYDGKVAPQAVADVTSALIEMGCGDIGLGDTIGAGTPGSVSAMLDAVLDVAPPDRLGGHFHDTGGQALANIETCLDRGLRIFDAAVGGLGGCPYAPGAKGNVATEAVLDRLTALGCETGLDADAVAAAGAFAQRLRS